MLKVHNMWYIYAHKNFKNEIVYIGIRLKKRLGCPHYKKPTYSKLWNNYFSCYKPKIEILLENLNQDEAYYQEYLAIKQYNPLLNYKMGGKNGKYTKKISKSNYKIKNPGKYPNRKGSNHPLFGKHQNKTSLAKNAASNGVKPYVAVKLDCGIVFGPFFYKRQASETLNIPNSSNIGSCLSGRLKSYKGYAFVRI